MAKGKRLSQKELARQYELKHLKNIDSIIDELIVLMERGARRTAAATAKRTLINNQHLPKDLRDLIDRVVRLFEDGATRAIIRGIERSRALAKDKTNRFAGKDAPTSRLRISARRNTTTSRRAPIAPRNTVAERFGNRFQPQNLSRRVWKLSQSYKKTIRETLTKSLREGIGAKQIAKELVKNLRDPTGTKPAGQGVYRSPRKNAERLARTEINMAYEWEDFNRWQSLWFVVGIEIRLSAQHPKYDICDHMVGIYPKDFMFSGWHPNCLCIAIPILAPQEIRDQMMDYELGLIDKKPDVEYVQSIPESAKGWMKENSKRIAGWSTTPYFIQFNDKYLGEYLQ